MSEVEKYFALFKEYANKYSDRICLLYQIGTFYEMYEFEDEEVVGTVSQLAEVLSIRITKKSTRLPLSRTNPLMIGIPVNSYEDKYKQLILDKSFTIIRYDQDETDKTKRVLKEMVSPGTTIDSKSGSEIYSNIVMSIYIECLNLNIRPDKVKILCGVSYIDVNTGTINVGEVFTSDKDPAYIYEDIYRIINSIKPKELLISINSYKGNPEGYLEYVNKCLKLESYPIVILTCNKIERCLLDFVYQESILNKVYGGGTHGLVPIAKINLSGINIKSSKGSQLDIFQELDIDKMHYAVVSFVQLLTYCYEHNEIILKKVSKPIVSWFNEDKRLILEYNTIDQLSILPKPNEFSYRLKKKTYDDLYTVLNNTSTNMGSRLLRSILIAPYTDVNTIKSKLDLTEFFYKNKEVASNVTEKLLQLSDIGVLYPKLNKNIIKPKDFCNLYYSLTIVLDIINDLLTYSLPIIPSEGTITQLKQFISYVNAIYNLDILSTCNLLEKEKLLNCKECPIKLGVSEVTDQFHKGLSSDKEELMRIKDHISELIPGHESDKIKLDSVSKKVKKGRSIVEEENEEIINMKDLGLYITESKAAKLRSNISKIDVSLCGVITIEPVNSKYAIRSDKINSLCINILNTMNTMGTRMYEYYKQIIQALDGAYSFFGEITKFISYVDLAISNAKVAHNYKYFKPEILEVDPQVPSFFEAKDLRHPIIERNISTSYIPNDLSLGKESYGNLIYGCNSSGKTALTLSVGLNIIMAQCGMFVPSNLTLNPYKRILTRLKGEDDTLHGKSSYYVEIEELRLIINHSDNYSLILGDEITRGTESMSGAALIITTIEHLVSLKSSFIFSTHIHTISSNPRILKLVDNKSLKISHLSSVYDASLDTIIYDRKIKEGSGEAIYGLEAAKYMGLPPAFISSAHSIRKELLGENPKLVNPKKSRYNSEQIVDNCQICGKRLHLETHHIKEQHKADEDGYIGLTYVHSKDNIIVICDECHEYIHSHKVEIQQKQTSTGIMLTLTK